MFACQAPKYSMSCKQRCTSDGSIPGIGWADDGIKKYNELYNLVAEDRALNIISFNRAFESVYTERQCIASNKLPRGLHSVNKAQYHVMI